jgi:hypothetical protein
VGPWRRWLDLDELARVPQDGDTEQGAGHVVAAEEASHLLPGGDQVAAIAAGHVDGRLDDIPITAPDSSRTVRKLARAWRICMLTFPGATTCPCSSSGQAPAVKTRSPWLALAAQAYGAPGKSRVLRMRLTVMPTESPPRHAATAAARKLVADRYGSTSAGMLPEPICTPGYRWAASESDPVDNCVTWIRPIRLVACTPYSSASLLTVSI